MVVVFNHNDFSECTVATGAASSSSISSAIHGKSVRSVIRGRSVCDVICAGIIERPG